MDNYINKTLNNHTKQITLLVVAVAVAGLIFKKQNNKIDALTKVVEELKKTKGE